MALVTNVVHGSAADRVLLLLHGYGSDARDLGGLLPYLDPEGHFVTVLPRGPFAAPPGFAWYEISENTEYVHRDIDEARAELEQLLDDACREHGCPRDQVVVGGFSQGAG